MKKQINLSSLNIIAFGNMSGYEGSSTCLHRANAMKKICQKVCLIDANTDNSPNINRFKRRIANKLFRHGASIALPDITNDNIRLLEILKQDSWDAIWLDSPVTISAETLVKARKYCPDIRIIGYSPDDMFGRHNQSLQFINALPFYDCFVTTKSYNVKELSELGCPKVVFVGNGFDPDTFRPLSVTEEDRLKFGGDVGFIGSYEMERAKEIIYLAKNGIGVRVWGGGWDKFKNVQPNLKIEAIALWGDDYAKACSSFKINLSFLRKLNRDLQTTRSVEIPACGGFMLVERTAEHQQLFEEGVEAEFFSSSEEMLNKCRYYLQHENKRLDIANRGYHRCLNSDYSNQGRIIKALQAVFLPDTVEPL